MKNPDGTGSVKCQSDCACKRHSQKPCQSDCTCSRHSMNTSFPCPPGCECGRHKKSGGLRDLPNEGISKNSRHRRIRKLRGRAAEYPCIDDCGKQAMDWSQIHGTDGMDLENDYVPRCRRCHLHYDKEARLNPESLAKWREKAGPAIAAAWTSERRAAASVQARTLLDEQRFGPASWKR
jgi:hypothetical protein